MSKINLHPIKFVLLFALTCFIFPFVFIIAVVNQLLNHKNMYE